MNSQKCPFLKAHGDSLTDCPKFNDSKCLWFEGEDCVNERVKSDADAVVVTDAVNTGSDVDADAVVVADATTGADVDADADSGRPGAHVVVSADATNADAKADVPDFDANAKADVPDSAATTGADVPDFDANARTDGVGAHAVANGATSVKKNPFSKWKEFFRNH
jgi:hypothetical protein